MVVGGTVVVVVGGTVVVVVGAIVVVVVVDLGTVVVVVVDLGTVVVVVVVVVGVVVVVVGVVVVVVVGVVVVVVVVVGSVVAVGVVGVVGLVVGGGFGLEVCVGAGPAVGLGVAGGGVDAASIAVTTGLGLRVFVTLRIGSGRNRDWFVAPLAADGGGGVVTVVGGPPWVGGACPFTGVVVEGALCVEAPVVVGDDALAAATAGRASGLGGLPEVAEYAETTANGIPTTITTPAVARPTSTRPCNRDGEGSSSPAANMPSVSTEESALGGTIRSHSGQRDANAVWSHVQKASDAQTAPQSVATCLEGPSATACHTGSPCFLCTSASIRPRRGISGAARYLIAWTPPTF